MGSVEEHVVLINDDFTAEASAGVVEHSVFEHVKARAVLFREVRDTLVSYTWLSEHIERTLSEVSASLPGTAI